MRNPSLMIILATVAINMTGVGLIWPILPSLVERLSGGTLSHVAFVYGALAVSFSLMQFLFAPVMGSLSDRLGRRPVMLVALAALGIDTALMAFAPSIFWVFVARIIGGMLASTFAIANASIADMFKPEERAAGFGMVGAALGVGFIAGPLLGGVLGTLDPALPFYVAAGLSFLNVAFGYFLLEETLPPHKRASANKRGLNSFAALRAFVAMPQMLPLALALLIATSIQRGLESVWVLFVGVQYGWDVGAAGLSLAVVGVCFVVVQGLLVRRIIARFGERNAIIGGFVLSALVYLALSVNTSGTLAYLGLVPHVLGWGVATPALQAIASRQVDAARQGALQGGYSAVQGLSAIIGPVLSSGMFAYFTGASAPVYFPGAFFFVGSAGLAAAALIGARSAAGRT